ncbi:abasic site processing protein HMCES-like isoform X2 [Anopheles cruzii]|uniref:abasic site processing protein HMCES-like isoform X2 n=1 Tax=Anopheles cruzii TaxID=68878 RepID=UPI0022EC61B9|nr:abasic site processing protein HMCES-like isoform X2 [Anopheles cruzii]
MCGRTCLTLDPQELECCCKYRKTAESKPKHPRYRNEFNCGKKYQPSCNVAPTDVTPVLVSAIHFDETADAADRLLVPMMWGMVPRWHKGDYRKHGLTTNNCRLEGLASSKLYGPPLAAGHRCVILCEGFYEWQTVRPMKSSERPVFYVHMPQDEKVKVEDRATWDLADGHFKLLRMAGLFDVWNDENGDKLYSYTVITFETKGQFAEIHHRSPAILESDEQVTDWLDYKRVPSKRALNMLQPCHDMRWYRISNIVNNSRNKSDQCNKPLQSLKQDGTSPKATPKSKLMQSWLIVKKRKLDETNAGEASDSKDNVKPISDSQPLEKKPKTDQNVQKNNETDTKQ